VSEASGLQEFVRQEPFRASNVQSILGLPSNQRRTTPRHGEEILIVLSGIKPGVDAMRVASGVEKNEHNVIDPETELAATGGVELVCESIPGAILQLTAAMRVRQGGGIVSNIAVGSIILSVLTTGYKSTCISFDYDVDPKRRRHHEQELRHLVHGGRHGDRRDLCVRAYPLQQHRRRRGDLGGDCVDVCERVGWRVGGSLPGLPLAHEEEVLQDTHSFLSCPAMTCPESLSQDGEHG